MNFLFGLAFAASNMIACPPANDAASSYLTSNKMAVQEFLKNKTRENFAKLPTLQQAQKEMETLGLVIKSRGNCPSGMSMVRSSGSTVAAPTQGARKVELYQHAYSDGNCAYVIHYYYDTGFLGLFPTETYACAELVGCI
jgi:hypothetical protein